MLAYCNDPHAGPDTEYSLHHRNYNPKTGIFKSEDPAADDLNLYRYVANNPVNNEDPSGLDFVTNEGNIAVWVIESALGWNGERIDLGVLEDGVIHLRSKFGGGTISYSALQEFVKAGLSNQHLQFGVSSLRNLDEQTRSFYINFAISEVYYRVTHGSLRAGDRGDENGNVTHYAGAGGPVAAALIVEMMRQVAIELGMEFGGAKAVSVMLRGGKVIFKRGGQIVVVTSDTIAKKLGRKVDDCEIQNASKILDTAPSSVSSSISQAQLEKKWKHAPDFGITTTKRNPATLADFGKAVSNHLDDVATIEKGTYLYVPDSKVFFNPNTNLVAILDKNGNFVSGWKLIPGTPQFENFIKNGVLR